MILKVSRLSMLTDAQELERFLEVALQVVDALGELHQGDLLHGGIRPQAIWIDESSGKVSLGSPSQSRGQMSLYDEAYLREYLPYISPEQTGRMNRSVDYRSDFYSLGATFYELLGGRPPFEGDDPMELIHGHIARRPQRLAKMNGGVPPVLSEIVMKLLAKNAEDRYQSSYGLKADLQICLDQWREKGAIEAFVLAQRDIPERLTIPQKLYGREAQEAALLAAFEQVAEGSTEMALVCGVAGVGKTALVQEVRRPIMQQRGYFISGKFDQYQRNLPYAALIQAFRGLVRQILTESKRRVATWQENLLEALGPNGQIIIDVITEVELIIGPQPPVPELPPAEAQNRFNYVFQKFVGTFTTQEHPLVLFLDDLQWADRPSLNLMARLMTQADSGYLFIIGAYRDNEVDSLHPLTGMLNDLEQTAARVELIELQPLGLEDINQLVAGALKSDAQQARPLAQLCLQKTDGNPLFLIHLLYTLYEADCLHFDRQRGQWAWDMGTVEAIQLSGDVVDLMLGKMRALSEQAQRALQLAACIGNEFEIEIIAGVIGKSVAGTVADLQPALKEGLVLTSDAAQQFVDPSAQGSTAYRFLHDRVQQAAYSLIPEDRKQEVHLKIGMLMLRSTPESEGDEKLLDIVNHLNRGAELIAQGAERDQLAELNLLAGQRAQAAVAYEPALSYLQSGMELLRADSWATQYELSYALHLERAECEYLSDNLEQAERLFDVILKNARTNLEKARVYNKKVAIYQNRGQSEQALEYGIEGLRLLGFRLPLSPSKIAILLEIIKARLTIGRRKSADLLELPEMTDLHKKPITDLLVSITPPAYFLNKDILSLGILRMLNISLRYGHTQGSSTAYVLYAFMLCSVFRDYLTGNEFGRMALALNVSANDLPSKCETYMIFGGYIRHWRTHIRECYKYHAQGYWAGLESGNFMFAGYCTGFHTSYLLIGGEPLAEIDQCCREYLSVLSQINNRGMFIGVTGVHRVVLSFMESFQVGDGVEEQAFIDEMKREGMEFLYYLYCSNKLPALYCFENYQTALEVAIDMHKNSEHFWGMYHLANNNFYYSLILAAVYANASTKDKKRYRKIIRRNQRQMRNWAENCPENFLHKYHLVEAELARLSGDEQKAGELYDQAIEAARESQYIQNEALASELAAKFYLTNGHPQIAQTYISQAHQLYARWGAGAKVQQLQEAYPELLVESARDAIVEPEQPVRETEQQPLTPEMAMVLPGYTLTECVSEERHVIKYHGFPKDDPGVLRSFMLYKGLKPQPAELAQLKATYAKLPEMSGIGLVEVHEVLETLDGLVLVLEELT